jgi:hypothetical protein
MPNDNYAIYQSEGELRLKLGFHLKGKYLSEGERYRYIAPNFLLSSELLFLNKYVN